MRKKRLLFMMISILALAVFLVGCGDDVNSNSSTGTESDGDEEQGTINLKLGHVVSTDSHYQVFATKLKELVNEKSSGSMDIEIFPQGQLGGEVAMFQATQSGTLDILVLGQSAITGTIKELSIFDLPYLFDDLDQANEILGGEIGDKYLEIMSDYDVVGLGYLSAQERNIFSNKPINNLSDMEGLKLRASETTSYVSTLEALGAQPTSMAFDEVYMALQQGVVDGASSAPDNYVDDKFVEVTDYYNFTKAFYLPTPVIASGQTWDSLTQEQRDIITESVNEVIPEVIDFYKKGIEESINEAEEAGTQMIEPELGDFREASESVYDELLKDIPNGQELLEEIQEATSE